MNVVLIKEVPGIGRAGEMKAVKPGFGRNFLIPQGYAVLPSDSKAQEIAKLKEKHQQEESAKMEELSNLVKKISGKKFIFKAKADKKGNLYGSIGPKEIGKVVGLDEGLIKEHFKAIGTYPLKINLGKDSSEVKIEIQKEK